MNGRAGTLWTKGWSLSLAPSVSVHLGFIRPSGEHLICAGGPVQLMLSERKRSPVVFSLSIEIHAREPIRALHSPPTVAHCRASYLRPCR